MLKLAQTGVETNWLIITEAKQGGLWSEDFLAERQKEIQSAKKMLGVNRVFTLGFETTKLDVQPLGTIIQAIANILLDCKPEVVFIPNHSDIHSDHKIGFEAAYSACKNFRAPFIEKVYMYECLSETEYAPPFSQFSFTPNTFIDISDQLLGKIECMKIFKTEISKAPFPRSPEIITALASVRGSRIGVQYAEAFSLIFSSNL